MIWLFDNGHNGMVGARYLTSGKRSPDVIPGMGIFEGEFNRDITKRVVGELRLEHDIDAYDLVPESCGVPLRERCKRANMWPPRNARLISIHANADGRDGKWTDANGLTVFHYPGSKTGRALAQLAHDELMEHCNIKSRGLKTARFAMLRRTRMPAILVEHGFMTNKGDARKLASDSFRSKIAAAYVDMILHIEQGA